jgi:hypothetical protein
VHRDGADRPLLLLSDEETLEGAAALIGARS